MFMMPLSAFTQDESFPFAAQYGGHEDSLYMHEHAQYYELVIVLEGSADHLVDSENYRIRKGDVFVIGEGTAHGYANAKQFRICNVMFRRSFLDLSQIDIAQSPGFQALFVLEPQRAKQSRFRSRLRLSGESFEAVLQTVRCLISEYNGQKDGWKTMVKSEFLRLVVTLSRLYRFEEEESTDIRKLADAIAYIEVHFREPITVAEIAEISHYSERQFNRLFTAAVGCLPGAYITRLRLESARMLLTSTDASVAEIADRCGYPDSSYFARIFKKHHHVTPTAYRALQTGAL